MEKTAIWTVFCFYPLPPLNNVEKLGEGGILNTLFKIPIMTANGAKMMHNDQAPLGKGLLQVHHDKCCSLVKLLCIYFCYFNLLNHG